MRLSQIGAAAILLLAVAGAGARDAPKDTEGDLWAVLIAGSAGYGNYRHQADVAHAYQILRRGGLKDDKIIVLMYDDVASSESNPRPGQLFNRPHGPDVYAGLQIDYSHTAVTAETFLAVLAGNTSGVPPPSRHSSGRVLGAGPEDKVFVYFTDHGAPGVLGMPAGPFLYADQLNAAIQGRAKAHGFKEMVIYIEACESGSIFQGLLDDNLSVYATTAANGHESSWGTYCPGMSPAPSAEFGTCLGDLYSVAWMENADSTDLTLETLKKQFQLVKQRVSANFTYQQGSHVMRFGAMEVSEEAAAEFMGAGNTGEVYSAANGGGAALAGHHGAHVPQRDADLLHLTHKYVGAAEGRAKAAALRELSAETSRRAAVDSGVRAAVASLLARSEALAPLRARHAAAAAAPARLPAGVLAAVADPAEAQLSAALTAELVEALVQRETPLRPEHAPLVDDWQCLRGMVGAWEAACGPMDQYAMRHTRAFANLCNAGVAPPALRAAAAGQCAGSVQLVGPDAHVAAA